MTVAFHPTTDLHPLLSASQLAYPSLLNIARVDFPTFCALVLRDEEKGNQIVLQDFQLEWCDVIERQRQVVLWTHPDAGKTSILSIGYPLWILGNDPRKRIAILSATQNAAKKVIRTIQGLITNSHALWDIFPNLKRGSFWTDTAIEVKRPVGIKDPSVQAYSPEGGNIQGARLDGLIVDDVLNELNTRTRYQREKVEAWIRASAFTRLSDNAFVAFLTNAWHPEDMAHNLEHQGWWAKRYPVLDATGASTWPERWPMERVEHVRTTTLGPVEFARQMLCHARDEETARFKREWIDLCLARGEGQPLPRDLQDIIERYPTLADELQLTDSIVSLGGLPENVLIVSGVDLSTGKEKRDLSAIFTLLTWPDGSRQILEAQSGRWKGPEIIERIASVHERYRSIMVVENNACFVPGSPVLTQRGYVPIETVQPGDLVWTHRQRWRAVKKVTSREYSGELTTIRSIGSPHIRCTPNHAFYARRLGRVRGGRHVPMIGYHRPHGDPQWVSASAIEGVPAYAAVAVPVWDATEPTLELQRYSETRTLVVDEAIARVIGLYMAEGGGGGKSQVQFTLNHEATYLAELVEDIANRFDATTSRGCGDGTLRVTVNSIEMKRAFALGVGAKKALTMHMLGWPLELLLAVVRGWLLGDGNYYVNNPRTSFPSHTFRATSISRTWIGQATSILYRAGYTPSLSYIPPQTSHIDGRLIQGGPAWMLLLNSYDTQRLFASMPVDEQAWWGSPLNFASHASRARTVHDALGTWTRFRSFLHETYSGMVWNLVVDEDESYTVDGLIVHNSQEFLIQWTREKYPGMRVRSFTTGRNKLSPEYGVESLAAELAGGRWIIPCQAGTRIVDPQIGKWISDLVNYDPGRHTGDILLASWIAREAARTYEASRKKRLSRASNVRVLTGKRK